MDQNKVRTYFLYALGEILLVVIGILIALQINNWNGQRVLNDQLHTYFEQIRDELNTDQEYLNNTIQELEVVVRVRLITYPLRVDYDSGNRGFDYIN